MQFVQMAGREVVSGAVRVGVDYSRFWRGMLLVGATNSSAATADAAATTTIHTHTHIHTKHTLKTLVFRVEFSEDLYLTAHNTHRRQISKPPAEFELKIPESKQPQTHALDRAEPRIGRNQ